MQVIGGITWETKFYSAAPEEVMDFLKDNTFTCYTLWKQDKRNYSPILIILSLLFIKSEGYDHKQTVQDFFMYIESEMRKEQK